MLAVVGNETIRECHEDVRWAERVTRDPRVGDEDAGSCRYRTQRNELLRFEKEECEEDGGKNWFC